MNTIHFTSAQVFRFCAMLLLVPLFAPAGAHPASANVRITPQVGQVVTWTGAGGDLRWSNPGNWDNGLVPRATDAVRFAAGSSTDAVVDPDFAGTVSALMLDEGYASTVRLVRDLAIAGDLQIRSGMLDGGSAALTVGGRTAVSGGLLLTPGNHMTVNTLEIQAPGVVRLGASGKLNLTSNGMPLTGDGLLDVTTNAPNSVEYTGHRTSDIATAGPAATLHGLTNMTVSGGTRARTGSTPALAAPTFTETSSLKLNPFEDYPKTAVIDTANGYAYFGTLAFPGIVVKVRLSDFTRVGALTLGPGENAIVSAVIDEENGYAYFGTGLTSPGPVVKVRLFDFTRVGALTLDSDAPAWSALIDTNGGFAYFCAGSKVVKVRLSDFTRVGELGLTPGEGSFGCATIDTVNGFAYFGTESATAFGMVKVRLSDFTRVGTLTTEPLGSAVIDPANGFAYFCGIGQMVKVRLSDFTRVGALTLSQGEAYCGPAVIDTANGFAYFGTTSATYPTVSEVLKVRLSDFTKVGAVSLKSGEILLGSAVIDTANGYAYFGTLASPGIVVRVRLSDLAVAQSADKLEAIAGDLLTYTLSLSNEGPIFATGLMLTDTLPVSVTFVSVTAGASTCNLTDGQVICSLDALAVGASTQVTIQVMVDSTGSAMIANTCGVTTNEPGISIPKPSTLKTLINPLHLWAPFVAR